MVKIIFNSYILRKITGFDRDSLAVEHNISIKELIEMLSVKYGIKFKEMLLDEDNKKLKMLMLVNGESISSIYHNILDNDTINIIPFVTGG